MGCLQPQQLVVWLPVEAAEAHVGQAPLAELGAQVAQALTHLHLGLHQVREGEAGLQLDAHTLGANLSRTRVHHLQQQSGPVLHTAAVLVTPLVRLSRQELMEQVAVPCVDLNAVKPTLLHGCLGGLCKLKDQGGDVGELQGAGGFILLLDPPLHVELTGGFDRGGGQRLLAAGQQGGVRDAARMEELRVEVAALGVHPVNHLLPTTQLLLCVQAWCAHVPPPSGVRVYALADQQPPR
mmetsp:Transcript_31218/g.69442  ORF Transcript_31218/g.69442 Transcript_31218/m.69442 type:complete len:238 (+) Transcript_31218:1212-1925(+)